MQIKDKYIGRKWALIFSFIGMFTAYFIMVLLTGDLFWTGQVNYSINLLVGVFGIFISANYLGSITGYLVIYKRYSIAIGIVAGVLILLIGTLMGSLLGFFQEGIKFGLADGLFDYIVKPIVWISLFGCIPVLIFGICYGLVLKFYRT